MAHYDLLVIGTGPAGQKAAIQAAKLGKKVGIVERKQVVGGVCTNTGTIPSKSLREAVLYLSGFHQRNLYGASYRVKQDRSAPPESPWRWAQGCRRCFRQNSRSRSKRRLLPAGRRIGG